MAYNGCFNHQTVLISSVRTINIGWDRLKVRWRQGDFEVVAWAWDGGVTGPAAWHTAAASIIKLF
jgi:hypothetical protein